MGAARLGPACLATAQTFPGAAAPFVDRNGIPCWPLDTVSRRGARLKGSTFRVLPFCVSPQDSGRERQSTSFWRGGRYGRYCHERGVHLSGGQNQVYRYACLQGGGRDDGGYSLKADAGRTGPGLTISETSLTWAAK